MIKKFFACMFMLAIACATVFTFTATPADAGYKSSSVRNISRSYKAPTFKATPARPAVKFTAPVRKVEPPARVQTRTVYRDRTVYRNTNSGGGGVMDSVIGTIGGMYLYDALTGGNDQPAAQQPQPAVNPTTLPVQSVSSPAVVNDPPEPASDAGGSWWPWLFGLLGLGGVGLIGVNLFRNGGPLAS